MHVKNTHTFFGMTSGKEAFRLPYNNGCTLPGRLPCPVSVHLYSTGGHAGRGQSLMECRTEDSSDIQTPGHCRSADTACSIRLQYMWPDATLKDDSRNMTQSVMGFVTMMASDAIIINGWRTRKVPECVVNLSPISSVTQWMTRIMTSR